MSTLTQERLKSLLSYDPETGLLTWIISTSNRAPVGSTAGSANRGYVQVRVDGVLYAAHRLAWFYTFGNWVEMIDHINANRSDNRIANLRETNERLNQENRRTACTGSVSGLLGVSYDRARKKWKSRIRVRGGEVFLGRFDSAQAAHEAYLKAKRELHEGCTL